LERGQGLRRKEDILNSHRKKRTGRSHSEEKRRREEKRPNPTRNPTKTREQKGEKERKSRKGKTDQDHVLNFDLT
jgi:hypothetical protein